MFQIAPKKTKKAKASVGGRGLKQGANPETGSDKPQIESKRSVTCVMFYCYKSSCFGSKRANVVIIIPQKSSFLDSPVRPRVPSKLTFLALLPEK